MNEVTFVILAYSRPSRLIGVIDSIHKFIDQPKILVYIDKAKANAPSSEITAQVEVISVCKDSKGRGLIQDYKLSAANQGTKVSYFECFDWGFTESDNVLLLEDDMIIIEDPKAFIGSSLTLFGVDRSIGMAVLFANFNHNQPSNSAQITNWPIMWGVLLNSRSYSFIKNFIGMTSEGDVEEIVSRFSKTELRGTLQSIFYRRFIKTWVFKYSRALESRTAWDTQWQFALWGLQLKTLVPSRSLVGDLGVDEYSVSTTRKKMEPAVCASLIRHLVAPYYYCRACESYREVQNFSLPEILRRNLVLNYLLLRGLL